jgi:hypothetical protein
MSTRTSAGLHPFEPVSDAVILVALDRAERHQKPNRWREAGVPWARLVEHLGFAHHSGTTRKLRPQVEALIDAGLVIRTKNSRRIRWGLTETGALRVAQARIDGEAVLPDSPQRCQWLRARSEAGAQIESVRERLHSELGDALKLLDGGQAESRDWYGVAERLSRECRRLGGAVFCLREWDEPDDEHPDLDLESLANREVRRGLSGLSKQLLCS